jgi:prepilin-type processing-associated H-X9-DG protein
MQAQRVVCLNNQKQLTLAWLLYANDNNGTLAINVNNVENSKATGWVNGIMNWDSAGGFGSGNTDNTNRALLANSLFSNYGAKSVAIYKCPGDHYDAKSLYGPRVRSISMNGQMGSGIVLADAGQAAAVNQYGSEKYKVFQKESDINNPSPTMTWVFIDEHADSINDGFFHVDMLSTEYKWSDWPASYHNGAGVLSFADGHSETHKWTDPAIANKAVTYISHSTLSATSPYTDLQWLQQRTTSLQ